MDTLDGWSFQVTFSVTSDVDAAHGTDSSHLSTPVTLRPHLRSLIKQRSHTYFKSQEMHGP